ncbi:MAG TPA: GIY-YIG nuclease family protein [Patescibacteria group bacterium]|nr:GIY-YIG nuclease family protein [Patescibacteria group bacterium]
MDRKKELKLLYKQTKPEMGIFMIRSNVNNKCYIQTTQDLRGVMNGAKVRLAAGMHPYKELQKDWNDLGSENFTIEILEMLEYDKDESKTDYTEDLALLQMIWEEKLTKENMEFYSKRL